MYKRKVINLNIILPFLIFFMVSILSIKSASSYTSSSLGNLVIKQCLWYFVGIVLISLVLYFKNDFLYRNSKLFYVIGNILLFCLLIFATPVNNSKCWFVIPGIGSFQPSEFMKIALMLELSVMIRKYHYDYKNPSIKDEFIFLIKSFIVVLIPSIFTFLEPDTGAVIMYLVIYFSMLLISGIRARWFLSIGIICFILILSIFSLYFFNSDTFINLFGTKLFYRFDRIFEWKNGSGLQLENALASIGSSGLFGHGFNKTPIYFPEASTDFIFAVFSSNFGFLFTLLFIITLVYFDIYIISLMKRKINLNDKFILVGISSCLIFQQIQNIGMTIGILPITGITLPFISYGGSSLLSYMIMVGIVLNISREKEIKYLN